jgi:hypothetical protein
MAVRTELAGPNVGNMGGRFRWADDTPENRLAQRSLYNVNPALPSEAVDAIATELQPGYAEIVEGMHRGHQAVILDEIAEKVEEKKKVVIDMSHPGLINAGVAYRAVCSALEALGVEFETVSLEGAMLAHLKVWLNKEDPPPLDEDETEASTSENPGEDGFIPTQNGIGLISQNALKTIPNTENTEELRKRFKEEVKEHNSLAMEVFEALMNKDVGMAILIIGSGTHDRRRKDDPSVIDMKPVAPRVVKMFMDNELEVAEVAAFDVKEHPFDVQLVEGPVPVTSVKQMNRRKGRLARIMTEQVAGVTFNYNESGLLVPSR